MCVVISKCPERLLGKTQQEVVSRGYREGAVPLFVCFLIFIFTIVLLLKDYFCFIFVYGSFALGYVGTQLACLVPLQAKR